MTRERCWYGGILLEGETRSSGANRGVDVELRDVPLDRGLCV